MLFIVFKMVETTFFNFREGFSLISLKLQRVFAWNFIQPSKYDSTSGTKISMFEKILGDEAQCGSEQAPLIGLWNPGFEETTNKQWETRVSHTTIFHNARFSHLKIGFQNNLYFKIGLAYSIIQVFDFTCPMCNNSKKNLYYQLKNWTDQKSKFSKY